MERIYDLARLLAPMVLSFSISFLFAWLALRAFVRALGAERRAVPKLVRSDASPAGRRR